MIQKMKKERRMDIVSGSCFID